MGRAGALWAILAWVALSGCAPGFYDGCRRDSECGETMRCELRSSARDGLCTAGCTTSEECEGLSEGAFCTLAGYCLIACTSDTECPAPAQCEQGSAGGVCTMPESP